MLEILENISLAPKTSFRIGGDARYYVEVRSKDELMEAVKHAKEKGLNFFILGGGTNVLVSDQGFDGVVIRPKFDQLEIENNFLTAGAGVPLIKAIKTAAEKGLAGMEDLAGIPGTIGGALRGNAGAFGSEIADVVESVRAFDSEKEELKVFTKEQCDFSYRSSFFKKNPQFIILSSRIMLKQKTKEAVEQETQETIAKRVAKELGGVKSAGSFFTNPVVTKQELLDQFARETGSPSRNGKIPAGWIIDQAGLRGKKIGGAMVSEKHANYIVNDGDATAEDVIMLVSIIKRKVRDELGVNLEQEVNYVGF